MTALKGKVFGKQSCQPKSSAYRRKGGGGAARSLEGQGPAHQTIRVEFSRKTKWTGRRYRRRRKCLPKGISAEALPKEKGRGSIIGGKGGAPHQPDQKLPGTRTERLGRGIKILEKKEEFKKPGAQKTLIKKKGESPDGDDLPCRKSSLAARWGRRAPRKVKRWHGGARPHCMLGALTTRGGERRGGDTRGLGRLTSHKNAAVPSPLRQFYSEGKPRTIKKNGRNRRK